MGVNTRDAVSLLGDMLLRDLFVQRGASQTPLIFIAHSFGGLIVKSVSAYLSDNISSNPIW
jgi:hypothetical protein